jgi:AcrR family transcriptional regulator
MIMEVEAVGIEGPAERYAVRCGRPPRGHEGKVDERILDAAAKVFLARGFSGASLEEIAEAASAGKPTIYARYPSKEALFAAVIERLVRRNTGIEVIAWAGATIPDRLETAAASILTRLLRPEPIGLIRVAVAEARRFPDIATSVSRMARERQTEGLARILAEFAEDAGTGALPAFAPHCLPFTAKQFLELAVLPMMIRALFGEDLDALRAEIGPHVSQSVAFFLAACGVGGDAYTRPLLAPA